MHTHTHTHTHSPSSSSPSSHARQLRAADMFDLKTEPDLTEVLLDGVEDEAGVVRSGGATLAGDEGAEDRISADDKKKLNVVIRAFAPELLKMRIQPVHPSSTPSLASTASTFPSASASSPSSSSTLANGNGASDETRRRRGAAERRARSTETLDDLLIMPDVSVQKLRMHFSKLQAPLITPASLRAHLSGSHIVPSRDSVDGDRRKLAAITTCMALIEEIGRRMRNKDDAADERALTKTDDHRPNKKRRQEGEYALHMRLPTGDFFTNAITLSDKEAAEVDGACAHLVATSTTSIAPDQDVHVPTLGERLRSNVANRTLPMQLPTHLERQQRGDEDYAKPVSHLYYGPWSSFAPTYDSFDGQLDVEASCALWRSKQADFSTLRTWSKARPTVNTHSRQDLASTLDELLENDDGLDIDVILAAYDSLPDDDDDGNTRGDVDEILQRNSDLLAYLQDLQEQRWRQMLARATLRRSQSKEPLQLAQPDENEQAIAQQLFQSLTQLLSAQPRLSPKTESENDGKGRHLVPEASFVRALASSASIDPALRGTSASPGVWGTLDESAYGPSSTRRPGSFRSSAVGVRPLAAIRDSETLRLPGEAEEKVTIVPIGAIRNDVRAKGSLDRFASSRDYSLEDHPHDRKPPVPPAPKNGVGPSSLPKSLPSTTPQQPGAPRYPNLSSSALPRHSPAAGSSGGGGAMQPKLSTPSRHHPTSFPGQVPSPLHRHASNAVHVSGNGQTMSYARPPSHLAHHGGGRVQ